MSAVLVNLTKVAPAKHPVEVVHDGSVTRIGRLAMDYTINNTELGFARRFVQRNINNVRYSPEMKTWFIWQEVEGYWREDTQKEIMELAQENIAAMYHAAADLSKESREF